MKIAMPFGPAERNDGGNFYIHKFLNKIIGVTAEYQPLTAPPTGEAIVYVDWAQDAYALPLPVFPAGIPNALWLSDTHMGESARQNRFEWGHSAGAHGNVRFYHPEAVEPYRKSLGTACCPQNVDWLPAATDHTIYTPPLPHDYADRMDWDPDPEFITSKTCEVIPRFDLAWVGHVGNPERERYLDAMFRAVPNFTFYSGLFWEEAARQFHQSAIVFNKSVRGDFNCRSFEALSTRSFLLTDRQRGMETLGLQDGVHCAVYDSLEEAIDKARFYLAHPALRRKIAEAGWRWVLNGNTYWHRARTLLELVGWKG